MASVVSITLACAAALAVALTAPASADEWIEVTPNGFDPPTATVDAGEAVHFTNRSGSARSVTAAGGAFASGEIPDGGGYSLALSVPGTHDYRSEPGGFAGQLRVRMTSLPGSPFEPANDHVPDVLAPPVDEEDTGVDSVSGMYVAKRRLMLSFTALATIAEANDALASVSAAIIGSDPEDGVLVIELADLGDEDGGESSFLHDAVALLESNPAVDHVSLDPLLESKRLPRPAEGATSSIGWKWDVREQPPGELTGGPGIWGIQAARFPQAWNWLGAIEAQKPPVITTAIVDDGFDASHPDLDLQIETFCRSGEVCDVTPPPDEDGNPDDHGNAMAGIIGATYDNAASGGPYSIGISGGNPLARMVGVPSGGFQKDDATLGDWGRTRQLFSRLLADGRDGRLQNVRVINFSVGQAFPKSADKTTLQWWIDNGHDNCGPQPSGDDGTGTLPCTPNNDDRYLAEWADVGKWARDIAVRAAHQNIVITQAAGNERALFCTQAPRPRPFSCAGAGALIESANVAPFAWASANWLGAPDADPVLVVGATNSNHEPTSYSNFFGTSGGGIDLNARTQLWAPGGSSGSSLVMPTLNGYTLTSGGTSAAAAFVSGAVGYLFAYQPTLTTSEVRRQLETWSRPSAAPGIMGNRLDVFASILGLPATTADGKSLAARRLVDVNDGSRDGNRRLVRHEGDVPGRPDRSAPAPDERIDMRDFRPLRDAWLLACGSGGAGAGCPAQAGIRLDGSATHRKKDLNLDSCVGAGASAPAPLDLPLCPPSSTDSENIFPRLDFNGDGRVDLDRAVKVPLTSSGSPASGPDAAASLTDLGVLQALFDADPRNTEGWTKASLPGLMRSGDLEIHGADLFHAGASEIEVNVGRPSAGDQMPTRKLRVGDRGIVVTAPVDDDGDRVRITAEAELGGQTIEAVPEEVDLHLGEDIRIDLCQGLRLKADPMALPADGASKSRITAVVRPCKPTDSVSGKAVTFTVEPSGPKLSAESATTNGAGEATVELTAGSTPATYVVRAAVELSEGRTAKARLELAATPKYKIAYHWRQQLLDWSESGSTRPSVFTGGWPSPPLPGQHDCTVPGTVEYCIDGFTIGPNPSDPAEGLERKGVLSGSGTRFELDEEVLKSKHSSSTAWTLSNPDGSDVREGSKSSRWGVIDPKQFTGEPMPPTLRTEATADGLELHGLSAVAELGYNHYLFATAQDGAAQPTEVHDAIPETLLIPRGDGSALRYASNPNQPILFRRAQDGTFEPYSYCGTRTIDRTTAPGYLDAAASPYIPGADDLGRKPVWAPGDRPMPVGPGSVKVSYAFVAAVVEDDTAPAVALPDCSQNNPPSADFRYAAPELAEGRVVRFTDLSTDPEGDLASWAWDFGDGSTGGPGACESTTEQHPCHLFVDNGTFTVNLTVKDGAGASSSKGKSLTIFNLPPTAHLDDQTVQAGRDQTIAFAMADPGREDKKALGWRLTSDDGRFAPIAGTDAAGNRTVTFPAPGLPAGEYPVTLKVTDKDGDSDSIGAQITVVAREVPEQPPGGSWVTCDPDISLDEQEHEFLTRVNLYRTQNGLAPLLGVSPTLTAAAERHAHDMAQNDFMEHTGSDGSTPLSRAEDAHYPGSSVGENLASDVRTAVQALFAWQGSQTGHNENMLNPQWRAIGIAREFGHGEWRWATSYGDELDCPPPASAARTADAEGRAESAVTVPEGPAEAAITELRAPAEASMALSAAEPPADLGAATSERESASGTAYEPSGAADESRAAADGSSSGSGHAPSPAFVVADAAPVATRPVVFTNRSRDAAGTPIAATIEFGDGSAAIELAPGETRSHAFPDADWRERYRVRVSATDAAGRSGAVERPIDVEPVLPPYLDVRPSDQIAIAGRPYKAEVKAYDQSSWEPIAGLELTFTVGDRAVTAVTDADGLATATLTLLDQGGSQVVEIVFAGNDSYKPESEQKWLEVTVNHPPVAKAGGPYVAGEGGSLLLNGSGSTDEDPGWFDRIAAYEWDLDGDGDYGDTQGRLPPVLEGDELAARVCGGICVPSRDYPVSLRVTDSHGDHDIDTTSLRFVADFDILLGGETKTIVPGQSNSFAVTVIGSRSYDKPVTLSVSGLPQGVTATFSKNPVTPTDVSVLTLTGGSELETGSFPVRVSGTDGEITKEVSDEVKVAFGLIPICYGRMVGVVRDKTTGQPLAGASVNGAGGWATTDASGRYEFGSVPLGWNNAPLWHTVSATRDGYWHASGTAEAVCGGVTRLDLELLDVRTGIVRGRVVDKDTREPLPDSTIHEFPALNVFEADEDGRFEGTATLGPQNSPRSWWGRAHAPGYWWQDKTVEFAADRPGELLYELVKQCTGTLQGGQVRYLSTNEPAVGARVEVSLTGGWWPDLVLVTDDNGDFEINREVPLAYNNSAAHFPVTIFPGESAPPGTKPASGSLRLEACGGKAREVLYLRTPQLNHGAIEGHVRDEETGAPLAGVWVTCGSDCNARTDENGFYRFDKVAVGLDGQTSMWRHVSTAPSGYYGGGEHVLVHANQTATVDLTVLEKRYGALGVSVVDSVTGAPIPGADVREGSCSFGVCLRTDREGKAHTSGIALGHRNTPVGRFLTAGAPGYWPQTKGVTIKADETATLRYELQPECEPARVVGTVLNAETQAPIEGAQVSGGFDWPVYTDAAGRFEIANIKPSLGNNPRQVWLTASASGFFSQTKQITIFCGARINVDFGSRTSKTGTIVGTVVDGDTGQPLADAFLGSDFGATARTGADGSYRFEDVPLGDLNSDRQWTVFAQPQGYKSQTKNVVAKADQEARLDFTFTRANQIPVADGQALALDEDTELPITTTGSDPDGDALTHHVIRWPQHGTLRGRLPNVTYDPDANYHGTDSFEFIVNDGVESSERTTVSLRVDAINDPPRAVEDRLESEPDASLRIPFSELLANDVDVDGDELTITSVRSNHPDASAAIEGDEVVFTPPPGWASAVQYAFLDYTMTDGHGGYSTAWVYIRVDPAPAAPRCIPHSFEVQPGQAIEEAVSCTDKNGDSLSYSLVAGPDRGTLDLAADGTFTYEAPAGFAGTTTFTFKASDGALDSEVATASIVVAPANEAPVAEDDQASVQEDGSVSVDVLANDRPGPENETGQALTADVLQQPAHGDVLRDAAGRLTYTPDANWHGPASFSYEACDDAVPRRCDSATVRVAVAPVNDAPDATAGAVSVDEDSGPATIDLGAHVFDVETGDADLAYEIVTPPAKGKLTGTGPELSYAPGADVSGQDSFAYRVTDGGDPDGCAPGAGCSQALTSEVRTVAISIAAVNDAPRVSLTGPDTLDEGSSAGFSATATDPDGTGPLAYEWSADGGILTTDGMSATLAHDDGPATVNVTVSARDSDGGTGTDTLRVTVRNVAPTADAGADQTAAWGLPVAFAARPDDPSRADQAAGFPAGWRFGDGSAADGLSVSHAYEAPGRYDAGVTVADKDGGRAEDAVAVTVTKRRTGLAYTGAAEAAGGSVSLAAKLIDEVDQATARVTGRELVFEVGGQTMRATTDDSGVATVEPGVPLAPGRHPVTVRFAEDSHYLGSVAEGSVAVGGGAALLVLDEEAIEKGEPPNRFRAADLNEGRAGVAQRAELPYFAANAGRQITLYSGQLGDEGWFAPKTIPATWSSAGPTADGIRNLLAAGPGLGGGSDPERLLDKVPDVTPLRAAGLKLLVGRRVCALVLDGDVGVNYGPLNASLKGKALGTAAFELVGVRRRSGSSTLLPAADLRIVEAEGACQGALELLSNAPVPRSASAPADVAP